MERGISLIDFLPVRVAPFAILVYMSAIPVAFVVDLFNILGGKDVLPLNTYPFWRLCYLLPDPSCIQLPCTLEPHVPYVSDCSDLSLAPLSISGLLPA